jgi:hypothetical protein
VQAVAAGAGRDADRGQIPYKRYIIEGVVAAGLREGQWAVFGKIRVEKFCGSNKMD